MLQTANEQLLYGCSGIRPWLRASDDQDGHEETDAYGESTLTQAIANDVEAGKRLRLVALFCPVQSNSVAVAVAAKRSGQFLAGITFLVCLYSITSLIAISNRWAAKSAGDEKAGPCAHVPRNRELVIL